MAKTKTISTGSLAGAKGGSTKMFGKKGVAPQKSGTTATASVGKGGKFAAGGSTKMFGKNTVKPQKPGTTATAASRGGK